MAPWRSITCGSSRTAIRSAASGRACSRRHHAASILPRTKSAAKSGTTKRPRIAAGASARSSGAPPSALRLRRIALNEAERAAWQEIDRQWADVDYALVLLHDTNPQETYVMRRTATPKWVGRVISESDLELEEVVAG